MATFAPHSQTMTETIARHVYTDGRNRGTGIAIGKTKTGRYAVALLTPALDNPRRTSYFVVKTWATEAEARAHGNRIHADKVRHGYLCGTTNVPA